MFHSERIGLSFIFFKNKEGELGLPQFIICNPNNGCQGSMACLTVFCVGPKKVTLVYNIHVFFFFFFLKKKDSTS